MNMLADCERFPGLSDSTRNSEYYSHDKLFYPVTRISDVTEKLNATFTYEYVQNA